MCDKNLFFKVCISRNAEVKDGNWEDPSGQIPGGGFSSGLLFCPSCQASGGVFKTGLTSITHGWPGPSLAVHLSAPSSTEPWRET